MIRVVLGSCTVSDERGCACVGGGSGTRQGDLAARALEWQGTGTTRTLPVPLFNGKKGASRATLPGRSRAQSPKLTLCPRCSRQWGGRFSERAVGPGRRADHTDPRNRRGLRGGFSVITSEYVMKFFAHKRRCVCRRPRLRGHRALGGG